MRPTGANITHISQNLKGCRFSCPNACYAKGVKEGLENSRRASPEEARDDADVPLGHLVRKLRLKADIEHLEKRSKDA